ncbi:MAG: altronate dehydratase [Selenomonadaceae bacterium]|nr:altronate dehydratase [Selenomonadaceae bacterium]
MTNAILLDECDNVATCTAPAVKGDTIKILGGGEISCVEDIPIWHKVALRKISCGEKVFKYGEIIGEAARDISAGGWVSHENIFSVPRDYQSEYLSGDVAEKIPAQKISSTGLKFFGYKRSDGRAGIRNHVLILPTCACGSETARIVASQVRGAVNIIFNTGCSDVQANTDMSQKILTGFACNPNVFGVVIIGLGCETVPHNKLREKIQSMTNKPVVSFGIQDEGGTLKTIERAVRAARELASQAGLQQKELCDASEILLGIECGGSDATSGIASNPAVGNLSDKLVDLGASTLMSESIEWIGGEHVLAKRAATPELHNLIIKICADYETHLKAAGQDCRAGQPTPGNKFGGLSTIDEKSLGCIRKGGTRPIVEVLEQAQRPKKIGALVMDTAGYDISSVTSMVAAGCNAIIFTTGRGTPTGNAIVPVLKVTANAQTFSRMEDNLDVNLSGILDGSLTIDGAGNLLLEKISDVLNGRLTKAEAYGFSDIAVDHVCRFV